MKNYKYVLEYNDAITIPINIINNALYLDNDLDYSFTVCFPGDIKKWKDIPFVEHPVLLLMSISKAKIYRRDFLPQVSSDREYKTAFENVVYFEN
jgi:hypothetical protein